MVDLNSRPHPALLLGEETTSKIEAACQSAERSHLHSANSSRTIINKLGDLQGEVNQIFIRGKIIENSWSQSLSSVRKNESALQRVLTRRTNRLRRKLFFYRHRWRILKITAALAALIIAYVFWSEIEQAAIYIWNLLGVFESGRVYSRGSRKLRRFRRCNRTDPMSRGPVPVRIRFRILH